MTSWEILKDFFKKTVLPVTIAAILFFLLKPTFTKDGVTNYLLILFCSGIPFGIQKMTVVFYAKNVGADMMTSGAWIALNFIIGGVIGSFVLVWRLICAAWYIPLTIYRLMNVKKKSEVETQ